MKKILALLGTIGLVATTSMAVISCQTEIKGDALKDLSVKFNEGNEEIAIANAPTTPKGLKDTLVQSLTNTLVNKYKMDKEGYLLDSKITDIKIGDDLILLKDSKLIDVKNIEQNNLNGIKKVEIVVETNTFIFQVNFSFNK